MDHGTNDYEARRTGSFSRTSSTSSSLRRRSLSLSGIGPSHIDDEIESENVSEAGDIGDRALHSNRLSESTSLRLSIDNALENGVNFPIPENNLLQSSGFWCRDPTNTVSVVTPLPEEIVSPLSTKALVSTEDKKQVSGGSDTKIIGVYILSCPFGCFRDSWGYNKISAAKTFWP